MQDKTLLLKKEGHLFGNTADMITQENIKEYFDIYARVVQIQEDGKDYHGIVPMNLLKCKNPAV